jgi:DNA invertase Pin-like site-specific DNA recombinase
LAQYERALTKERIMAGLEAAKRRDKRGGRPYTIREETMEGIREALQNGASKAAVCRTFGVKRSTLYDALARETEAMYMRRRRTTPLSWQWSRSSGNDAMFFSGKPS